MRIFIKIFLFNKVYLESEENVLDLDKKKGIYIKESGFLLFSKYFFCKVT